MHCLALIAALMVASVAAGSCSLYCAQGTVQFSPSVALAFQLQMVPCTPSRILSVDIRPVGAQSSLVLTGSSTPTFSCASNGQLATLTLTFGASRRFAWSYETSDSCATVLANLDTIPGTYVGSNHLYSGLQLLDDSDMGAYQVQCAPTTDACAPLQYSTGVLAFNGRAEDKSACGTNGTTRCSMIVQFTTLGGGDCASQGGLAPPSVTGLQVIVRPNNVLFSSYNPDALAAATLSCADSVVTLQSEGVRIVWQAPTDNSASCAVLLANLARLATARASIVSVELSSTEQWVAYTAPSLALPAALQDTTPVSGAGANTTGETIGDGGGDVEVSTVFVTKPVRPTLYCNHQWTLAETDGLPGWCCAVFGFVNPNLVSVSAPVAYGSNYLNPKPHIDSMLPMFPANTTLPAMMGVSWHCNVGERHFKDYIIKTVATDDSGRIWEFKVTANRERNDCDYTNDPNVYNYCYPPIPTGVPDN